MIEKCFARQNGERMVKVTFRLPATLWVDTIHLVGDFNGWNCISHPLRQDRAGNWFLTVELEANRIYQFRYLCDGTEWFNDNQADAYIYNPAGSSNFAVVTDPDFVGYVDGSRIQL